MTPVRSGRPGRDFPRLGLNRAPSPITRATWFVTAVSARQIAVDGRLTLSGGPFHAKRMGTTDTACGVPAESWKKLWDVPFTAAVDPRCPDCDGVVWRP